MGSIPGLESSHMCHSYWAHALQQEKPLQWEACVLQLESSPCLPKPEKAWVQQPVQPKHTKYPAQPKINQWINKYFLKCGFLDFQTHNGILCSNKKEWNTDTYYNMNEPWKRAKWEKSDTKGHILYDSTWNVHKRQKEYTKSRCAWGMGSDYQGEFLFQVMKMF